MPASPTVLWTLCDAAHPELGFCLTVAQAREINRRNVLTQAAYRTALVDEHEARMKAEGQLAAEKAYATTSLVLEVVLPVLGTALGAALGVLASKIK